MNMKGKELPQSQDAAHYGYWRALYLSFYSSQFYVDVAKRWHGFALPYLLLVIILASLPFSYRVLIDFYQYYETEIAAPFDELPILFIKDGQVILNKPMPFFVKNRSGDTVAIVDTTGIITKFDDNYPQLRILITKDKLYFRPPSLKQFVGISKSYEGNTVYTHTFGTEINGIFYGRTWIDNSGFSKLKTATKFIIFPMVILIAFIIYCLFLFVFSSIGQLCSNAFYRLDLNYKQVFRLLTVASTAQIFLFFIGHSINWNFRGLGFIYFILIVGYFFYGLSSVKKTEPGS